MEASIEFYVLFDKTQNIYYRAVVRHLMSPNVHLAQRFDTKEEALEYFGALVLDPNDTVIVRKVTLSATVEDV